MLSQFKSHDINRPAWERLIEWTLGRPDRLISGVDRECFHCCHVSCQPGGPASPEYGLL